MQKKESKQWITPKIVVLAIDEADIVMTSPNAVLVMDDWDDGKAFNRNWYDI